MIDDLLRQVRLPHARAIATEVLRDAKVQRWEPAEVVRALLTAEAEGRERSATTNRRKAAKMPTGKTFDVWNPKLSTIPTPTQNYLRTLEFIPKAENIVIAGPSGTGKSFFLEALGHAAIDAGHSVGWYTIETLGTYVNAHRIDNTINKAIAKIMRHDLIVFDDVALLPVTEQDAEAFYRVVDAAYEKRSIAISSNTHPAGFHTFLPNTNATIDRLLHHAIVCQTEGESIRYQQAQARQHPRTQNGNTRRRKNAPPTSQKSKNRRRLTRSPGCTPGVALPGVQPCWPPHGFSPCWGYK